MIDPGSRDGKRYGSGGDSAHFRVDQLRSNALTPLVPAIYFKLYMQSSMRVEGGDMSGEAYPETPAEWETHRQEITNLYLAEGKTLREVKQIMQARHGFKAT